MIARLQNKLGIWTNENERFFVSDVGLAKLRVMAKDEVWWLKQHVDTYMEEIRKLCSNWRPPPLRPKRNVVSRINSWRTQKENKKAFSELVWPCALPPAVITTNPPPPTS